MATIANEPYHDLCPKLEPVGHLDQGNRDLLMSKAQSEELAPRSLLAAADESEWLTYLVEGEIALLSGGFVKEKISSDSPRALEPLFADMDVDRAITELGATVLQVGKDLFEALDQEEKCAATELTEIATNDVEGAIFKQVSAAFANKTLELPNFPDVALKIRRAVNSPDIGAAEVSQIVQADPVLAARLMHVSNSPLYRGWKDVQSVRDAISRLGLESTRSLAISLAVKALFKARSLIVKKRMQALYQQSTYISAVSYVITQQLSNLDPERALFAGLIHDIGIIPILNHVDNHPGIVITAELLEETLCSLKAPIGAILVSAWDFDQELVELVETGDDWLRDTGKEVDYIDIVLAARWHVLNDTGYSSALPEKSTVSTLAKLGLDGGEESDFLDEARDEIAVVHQILQI